MKKRLSLLMVLMMVLSLVPMSAFATAGTVPGGIFSIDDTDETANKSVSVKLTQAAGTKFDLTTLPTTAAQSTLTLNKGDFDFTKTVSITDENGIKIGNVSAAGTFANRALVKFDEPQLSTSVLANSLQADGKTLKKDLDLYLNFNVNFTKRQDAGDVTLTVEDVEVAGNTTEFDVAKPIVVGVVKEGTGDDMKVTVKDATTKVGFDGGELSEITIKDIDKNKTVAVDGLKLELPDYMEWAPTTGNAAIATSKITVGGVTKTLTIDSKDKHIATVALTAAEAKQTVIVEPSVKVNKRDASKGDVSLKVMAMNGTTKLETVTVTAGVIADFDVTIKAWEKGKKEIPAMYGGDDATIKVKMTGVKGSFTAGRDIDFTVKGADIMWTGTEAAGADVLKGTKNLSTTASNVKKDGAKVEDGEFTLTVPTTAVGVDELEFELKIKAKHAQNGAVTLTAESRDFGKLDAEIAKVTPAYTVETKITTIKKGESLATADIVIKEAKAGLIETGKFLVLNLADRNVGTLTFGSDYKVEATNGMKLSDGLYDVDGGKKHSLDSLALEVKTASSKEAATITISNVLVKVDGATVDGEKTIDSYLVEKNDAAGTGTSLITVAGKDTAVQYALSKVADLDAEYATKYINVVKEYGTVATTTVFKIGSKEYTVNGESKTANEAPYVSGKGYTMLPVRAIGEALGLKADWNASTKTATFSNDSKVASVVIGADVMYVNGTPFKLSAKAEIKNGSTFVELRSLASAFGVKLEWDAATKSVTIQG